VKFLVGLGNPGTRYHETRHNSGFLWIDALSSGLRPPQPGSQTRFKNLWVQEASVAEERVFLVKPLSFMNRSGEALGPLLKFFKATPQDLLVCHDELDLDPPLVKIKLGGGAGGHRGLLSLEEHLKTRDFPRLRIGIGHPRRFGKEAWDVADFVLERVKGTVWETLRGQVEVAAEAALWILNDGLEKATSRLHTMMRKKETIL
jgi:peptidyl-tRNA hydrolase, PTH1 family